MKANGGILLTGNVYFSEVSKLESRRAACDTEAAEPTAIRSVPQAARLPGFTRTHYKP